MKKRNNRNRIDFEQAMTVLRGFGLHAVRFNHYQIRIQHPETNNTWDWYHTTGSTVRQFRDSKVMYRAGTFFEAEDLAEFIKTEENK